MLPYSILPEAEKDLDHYVFHIAKDNLDIALRLYDSAEETYNMLAEQPKIGERYPSQNPSFANIRFFPITNFKKYLIFYQITDNEINILRVLHTSRDIIDILS